MPGNSLLYSDIDPNVIELLYRRFKTPIEQLIDNKLQRRQLWGPTFKQEDIYECALPDADFRIPEPENGKRTWIFTGTLTGTRVIRVPPIVSAWWFVFNKTDQPLTFLIDPAGTVGPTLLAGALGVIITDGEEIFGLTGGDSGTSTGDGVPGGTPTQLQYKLDATTFGGATGSSVSGANIGMGGTLTVALAPKSIRLDPVSQEFPFIQFDRTGPDIFNSNSGAIVFRGNRGGIPTQSGYLRSYYNEFFGLTMEMGVETGTTRIAVEETASVKAVTMNSGTHFFQVEQGGLRTSEGAAGAMLYQDGAPLYLKALEIGLEHQVLKVVDIGGGVLRPRWGAGVTAGLTPPGGTATQIQYHSATDTFEGITGTAVNGRTITLGGDTHIIDTVAHSFYFQRTTDVLHAEAVGTLIFREFLPGDIETRFGYLAGYRDDTYVADNQVLELGQTIMRRIHIDKAALSLDYDNQFLQLRADGIRISGGVQGAFFYQEGAAPTGPIYTPLPIGADNTWLKSNGVRPVWTTLPAGTARLDQVTSPLAATNWNMAGWQVRFRYDGAVPDVSVGGGVLIDSTSTATGQGTLLLVRNTYTDDNAARLFACQIGSGVDFPLAVTHIGAVGMGGVPNPGSPIADTFRLQIFSPSGGNGLYVSGTVRFTGGTPWGVYYLNGTSQNLATSAATAGFLKSTGSAPPAFTGISMSDVSGVVPIAQGGTGLSTPPGAGQILIGNGTIYGLGTITNGGGISVSYTGGNIQLTAIGGSTNDSLDTILDPLTNSELIMGGYQVRFRWDGAVPVGGVLIDSTTNSASGGTLLWVRNTYSDNNAARLLVCQIGSGTDYPLAVTHIGAVGMGGVPNIGTPTLADTFRLQVFSASGANGLYVSGQTRLDHAGGVNWGVYYRDGSGNIVTSTAGVGFVKKTSASVAPSFATQIALGTEVSGTLPTANGGTGRADATIGAGQLLIGNGAGYGLGTITNGGGISVSYTGGNIQLTATGGSVNDSLDTVLDPLANSDFNMNTRQVKFTWAGSVPSVTTVAPAGGGVCIESDSNAAGQGTLLLVRNTYSDNNAARLLVCQVNYGVDYPLAVTHIGAVGMGGVPTAGTPTVADTFRLQVFAPSSGTLNALFARGQVQFDIPGMSDNSLYYRATGGNLAGIPAAVTAGRVAMSDGSTWAARAITVVGGSVLYTGGVLQLTTPGGSATPGGSSPQLQWNNGGLFGGVANSLVTAAGLITLEERSDTLTNALLTLRKTSGSGGVVTSTGHIIGRILFQGLTTAPSTYSDYGEVHALHTTTGSFKTIRMLQGAPPSYRVIALKDSGTGEIDIEVASSATNTCEIVLTPTTVDLKCVNSAQTISMTSSAITLSNATISGTLTISGGTNWGVYYRNNSSQVVTSASGAGYLNKTSASVAPTFVTSVPAADVSAGTHPNGRFIFGPTSTTPGLNVGTVNSLNPSGGQNGDIWYHTGTNKFRAFQGGTWVDMIGAGGSLSIDGSGTELLRRTTSSSLQTISGTSVSGADVAFGGQIAITHAVTTNQASIAVIHTLSGSNTITNADYALNIKFVHNHSGNANDGRRGMTLYWSMLQAGTQTAGKRDTIFEIYADSATGTYTSYRLTGIRVGPELVNAVNDWIGMQFPSVNATNKKAIVVDSGGGDVIFNNGSNLVQSATSGFLYVPLISLPGSASPPSGAISVPAGTCALAVGTDNALWANRGTGWMKVYFS